MARIAQVQNPPLRCDRSFRWFGPIKLCLSFQFKEISHAYEVLSDPQRREQYDQFGEEGPGGGGGFGGGAGMSADDLFENLFGGGFGGAGFGDFGGGFGGPRRGPRKGESIKYPLQVALEDLYLGTHKKMALERNRICGTCSGKGGRSGAVKPCAACKGRGFQIAMRQIAAGMVQQMRVPCDECNSSGEVAKNQCKRCKGKKVTPEKKILDVFIEKGMVDGQKICMKGEGDEEPGLEPGDVNMIIKQKDHPVFTRKGGDLFCHAKITLAEALCGFNRVILTHLDGRGIQVAHPRGKVIQPGQVKRILNEGMPTFKRPDDRGDLYIQFDVEFPADGFAADQEIQKLQDILPRPVAQAATQDIVDECALTPGDMAQFGSTRASKNAYDEDDHDSEEEGGGGMRCAQQ